MKLRNIVYLDSSINIFFDFFDRTGRDEPNVKVPSPENIQHIRVCYSIGLTNGSGSKVNETVKIEKEDIRIIDRFLILSFPLDDLHTPGNCEIIIDSMTIILKDNFKYKINIGKAFNFKNIISDTSPLPDLINKSPNTTKKQGNPKQKFEKTTRISESPTKKIPSKNFTDSYEKFKEKVNESEFLDLFRRKTGTIDFNLKNFGISLLCKLLLLTKYVNELVDNEFQEDLQEFLKINFIERAKKEALI